mmetsp:Transcript_12499/g.29505  ORF Transcript_12499/g.29505 Transcript_12499/m.29505 type:complete len:288 (-) Transcript_12499:591-1454(-)
MGALRRRPRRPRGNGRGCDALEPGGDADSRESRLRYGGRRGRRLHGMDGAPRGTAPQRAHPDADLHNARDRTSPHRHRHHLRLFRAGGQLPGVRGRPERHLHDGRVRGGSQRPVRRGRSRQRMVPRDVRRCQFHVRLDDPAVRLDHCRRERSLAPGILFALRREARAREGPAGPRRLLAHSEEEGGLDARALHHGIEHHLQRKHRCEEQRQLRVAQLQQRAEPDSGDPREPGLPRRSRTHPSIRLGLELAEDDLVRDTPRHHLQLALPADCVRRDSKSMVLHVRGRH